MADIGFLVEDIDDTEEDQDDGCEMEQDDPSILDQITPEELLSPIIRMEKYMHSDVIFNRQMAARYTREALNACRSKEDVYHVLRLVVRLSEDIEPCVRVELMEQIPHVALYCYEHFSLMEAVPQYILYVILRYLMDSNNQVRKTSQHVLLELLKHELVERADVEDQICPVLMQLTAGDSSDDYRSEAVTLMSKMAPLVGPDITERYFVQRFETLCCDTLFHVRKVCASTFGEICNVVGPELTTDRLLPVFFRLCQDGVWGVRKSCAESFMSVSSACPSDVRTTDLADVFVNLLNDKSRWVQMAAYQNLGPFISTFADPSTSGFYIDENGALCPVPKSEEHDDGVVSPTHTEAESTENTTTTEGDDKEKEGAGRERGSSPEAKTTDSGYVSPPELPLHTEQEQTSSPTKDLTQHCCIRESEKCNKCPTTDLDDDVDEQYFNSFLFWREPLPQVEFELGSLNSVDKNKVGNSSKSDKEDESKSDSNRLENNENKSHELETNEKEEDGKEKEDGTKVVGEEDRTPTNSPRLAFNRNDEHDSDEDDAHLFSLADDGHDEFDFDDYRDMNLQRTTSFEEEMLLTDHLTNNHPQNVIPQALLDHYISMTEPSKAQTIDTEITRHCAFSFPAVTLTLGRHNWPCLRDTYEYLSSDMQWKVRRTLAFSIHVLAKVLGEEMTRIELVPIFNSFLKDLDEVRIGVLKHLADFIELLPVDNRLDYLPVLVDFLTTDNNRNWRFRHELAEQLMRISRFYNASCIQQFICPIAITLATDRVADVRTIAFKLIGILLRRLHSAEDDGPSRKFVSDIIVKFANSQQWTRRQAYAQLCHTLLEDNAESGIHFCKEFLPNLLHLLSDRIPNVRLSVARTLTKNILHCEYFSTPECKERDILEDALQKLQIDTDRDVRYFAGAPDTSEEPSDDRGDGAEYISDDNENSDKPDENSDENGDDNSKDTGKYESNTVQAEEKISDDDDDVEQDTVEQEGKEPSPAGEEDSENRVKESIQSEEETADEEAPKPNVTSSETDDVTSDDVTGEQQEKESSESASDDVDQGPAPDEPQTGSLNNE
ncbi:serine/threonine-protein phosphatase 4 regulatory subunit 1-like isoform X2 [Actinia tenebrosa]|uniref:Serine/threonine-protein phosphatase 4 regulatory subunit 1-like isoform X2 n=1 Tax=Actinia tenebrosa TaxID=6105 RepID=A0A6P8HAH9_ACTTE|nr:serine/threonine-protein phosphatase 4 regulatory subunit 1-like isoform X2 [Actinia tenebrosa]